MMMMMVTDDVDGDDAGDGDDLSTHGIDGDGWFG